MLKDQECRITQVLLNDDMSPNDWIYEIQGIKGGIYKVSHKDLRRDGEFIARWMKKDEGDDMHGYGEYLGAISGLHAKIVLDESELVPTDRVWDEWSTQQEEQQLLYQNDENETKKNDCDPGDIMDIDENIVPNPFAKCFSPKHTYYYANQNNKEIIRRCLLNLMHPISKKECIASVKKPNVGRIVMEYCLQVSYVTQTKRTITDHLKIVFEGTGTIIDKEGKVVMTAAHVVGPFLFQVTQFPSFFLFFLFHTSRMQS